MKTVKIKLKNELAKMPAKKYDTDACYDVVATSIEHLGDGRIKYGLGLHIELPWGYRTDVKSRSSIHETGLVLSNGIGTCDEGYTGEYSMVFYHVIPTLPPYKVGDRIGQISFEQRHDVVFKEVKELQETARGNGGYGHTGLTEFK